jgi:DNA polymerase-3 subunit alpha
MWEELDFGGIINNVQHRVAKTEKAWGIFTLEGYDSYEFKILERRIPEVPSFFYSE